MDRVNVLEVRCGARRLAVAVLAALVWVTPAVSAAPSGSEISAGLKAVGGGVPVRVVWLEDANAEAPDPFGDAASYRLAGWDSSESTARRLLDLRGNWARPMISPDGETVIFTDRGRSVYDRKERFEPVMMALDWKSGVLRRLGVGHAVDVRREAAGPVDWVYFIDDVVGGAAFTLSGNTLGRFPLKAPDKREVVWNHASMAVDNLQVSRDGTKFVGLFPGREAAVVDVPTGRWHKLATGCWPSLAPDDSYLAWVFDGPHRNVRMFQIEPAREWKINIALPKELHGAETFHPRWSNHPRVIAFTGPFEGPKKAPGEKGNPLRLGARAAEIQVARLSADRTKLERLVQVTHNRVGDFFPDVWVHGGDAADTDAFAQQPALAFARPVASGSRSAEAAAANAAVFRWISQRGENRARDAGVAGGERTCLCEARGLARLSPFHGMWLDGGWFEADATSAQALAAGIRSGRAVSVAMTLTEWADDPAAAQAVLVSAGLGGEKPFFAMVRRGGRLEALLVPSGAAGPISLGGVDRPVVAGRAVAVGLVVGQGGAQWHINGEPSGPATPMAADALAAWPERAQVIFGAGSPPGGGWRGSLEGIVIHASASDGAAMRALAIEAAAATVGRDWPVPVTAKARLISATTPDLDKLDTYRRMLVDHVYEVVSSSSPLPKRISVLHWAVLDGAAVPGFPRTEGAEYDLVLDPYERRPELDSELTDISSDDYALPMFLDVTPPASPAAASR